MKTKNKVIYISLGFQELESQLYSRVANVDFVRRADRDHYLFTTVDKTNPAISMLRGSTPCERTVLKTIYESPFPTANKAMDPDWDWSARYIITNAAKKDGLNAGFSEFEYVGENTKIIITGHGKTDSSYLYTHIFQNRNDPNKSAYYDYWTYKTDRKDFIVANEGRISLSDLAEIIQVNLKKHNPNYRSSIESPLHISLSSCLMAFTNSYDPKNAGAAKLLTALMKRGITAEIRARVTSATTPNGADEQERMGLGTGAIGRILASDWGDQTKRNAFKDKIYKIGGRTQSLKMLQTHKERGYNFTYKWESKTKMTVTESSDKTNSEGRNKEQIIMNLYYIAYRTNIGDKRQEILSKIQKYTETKADPVDSSKELPVMNTADIMDDLHLWVNNRGAQIHSTGALSFGKANSVKVIGNMIDEYTKGQEISPYRENHGNLTNSFLFMRQKVTILENLYLLAYRTNLNDKQNEILTKAEALQLQADSSAASALLTDWLKNLESKIYLDSGKNRIGGIATGSNSGPNTAVKTIQKMVSELSQKKTITVLQND
jgi:hypothetical protein